MSERELLKVGGREIAVSNPRKVLFPEAGYTKLDLVRLSLRFPSGRATPRRSPGWRTSPASSASLASIGSIGGWIAS